MTKRSRHPLYFVWYNMFRYCRENLYYTRAKVSVCDAWRDRAAFEAWALRAGWRSGLTLARRDKCADFSPENCVFVPRAEANGMRSCVRRLPNGLSSRDICGRSAPRRVVERVARRLFSAHWDVASAVAAPPLWRGAAPVTRPRRGRWAAA